MSSLLQQVVDRFTAVVGVDPEIRPAARVEFGHYQSNVALRLANERGVKPRALAEEIAAQIDIADLATLTVGGPGFISIRLTPAAMAAAVAAQVQDAHGGVEQASTPGRVVVDYSAPNVAKPMHVGNLRSTIIGDCLVRVLAAQGHTVIRQNHIGDWGTQFGMLVEQILFEQADVSGLDLDSSVALYKRAQAHFKDDADFAEAARRRVVALQSGDAPTRAIWQALIDVSKAGFNQAYRRLGVLLTDADLAGESLYNPMLPAVAADLTALGIAVEDAGALCVFLAGDDAPLIVRKSDGGYGYAATDLAAIRYRVGQLGANRLIYVVGAPQAHHFQQVFATARLAGWLPDNVSAEHVGFGSVLGPDGRMFRTRDGKAVSLDSLLDLAEEVATPEVAMAAVKYADLSNSLHQDYVFAADRMTATTGNTGPYLQYAHARAHQILRRAEAEGSVITDAAAAALLNPGADAELLASPAELAVLFQLTRFADAVNEVADTLRPHKLCAYLYDLAVAASTFYEQCPVLKAEGAVRLVRLVLWHAIQRVLATGLDLLGIVAPDRM